MRENFLHDIRSLLASVPAGVWDDRSICGLLYDFVPWHGVTSVSIQLQEDAPSSPADWRHFECAHSEGDLVREAIQSYEAASDQRLAYHRLLIQAAEALLKIDFAPFGQAKTIDGFSLYPPFRLRVEDPDRTFSFNYCEYVLAKKLDSQAS